MYQDYVRCFQVMLHIPFTAPRTAVVVELFKIKHNMKILSWHFPFTYCTIIAKEN